MEVGDFWGKGGGGVDSEKNPSPALHHRCFSIVDDCCHRARYFYQHYKCSSTEVHSDGIIIYHESHVYDTDRPTSLILEMVSWQIPACKTSGQCWLIADTSISMHVGCQVIYIFRAEKPKLFVVVYPAET